MDIRLEIRQAKQAAEKCDELAKKTSVVKDRFKLESEAAAHRTRVKDLERALVESVKAPHEVQVTSNAERARNLELAIAAQVQKQKDCQRYMSNPERWLDEAKRDRETAAKLIKQAEEREALVKNAKSELIAAHDRALELRAELNLVRNASTLERLAELQAELAEADPELLAMALQMMKAG